MLMSSSRVSDSLRHLRSFEAFMAECMGLQRCSKLARGRQPLKIHTSTYRQLLSCLGCLRFHADSGAFGGSPTVESLQNHTGMATFGHSLETVSRLPYRDSASFQRPFSERRTAAFASFREGGSSWGTGAPQRTLE
jgi:hypothetical protein